MNSKTSVDVFIFVNTPEGTDHSLKWIESKIGQHFYFKSFLKVANNMFIFLLSSLLTTDSENWGFCFGQGCLELFQYSAEEYNNYHCAALQRLYRSFTEALERCFTDSLQMLYRGLEKSLQMKISGTLLF